MARMILLLVFAVTLAVCAGNAVEEHDENLAYDVEELDESLSDVEDVDNLTEQDFHDIIAFIDTEDVGTTLQGCRHMKCTICRRVGFLGSFCGVIEFQGNSIVLSIKKGGNTLISFRKRVTGHTYTRCFNKRFSVAKGTVCAVLYNINIQHKTACLRITYKVKVGWFTKKGSKKIGCV